MLSIVIVNAFRNGEGLADVRAGGAPGSGAVRHSVALARGGGNEACDAGLPTAAGARRECECPGEQWHDAVDAGRAEWTYRRCVGAACGRGGWAREGKRLTYGFQRG